MVSGVVLKNIHDYYYQVMGQLALKGAQFCDFVIWTEIDMHTERISFDATLWNDMWYKQHILCHELEILEHPCS